MPSTGRPSPSAGARARDRPGHKSSTCGELERAIIEGGSLDLSEPPTIRFEMLLETVALHRYPYTLEMFSSGGRSRSQATYDSGACKGYRGKRRIRTSRLYWNGTFRLSFVFSSKRLKTGIRYRHSSSTRPDGIPGSGQRSDVDGTLDPMVECVQSQRPELGAIRCLGLEELLKAEVARTDGNGGMRPTSQNGRRGYRSFPRMTGLAPGRPIHGDGASFKGEALSAEPPNAIPPNRSMRGEDSETQCFVSERDRKTARRATKAGAPDLR